MNFWALCIAVVVLIAVGGIFVWGGIALTRSQSIALEEIDAGDVPEDVAGGPGSGGATGASSGESLRLSPKKTYAIAYDLHSKNRFQIIRMPNTLIRDYVSENGESIICRTTCYPYARWLDDSRLIIGSYVLTQEGNPNSIVTTGAEVFNAATQQFTTPTQTELASFNAATNVGVTGQSNNNSTPPVSPTDPVTISPDPVTPTDIPLEDFIYEEPVIEITDTVIGSATVAIALGESIEFRMNGTNPPTATVTLKSVSSGEATFELRSSTIRDVKTLPVGEPTILMQDSCEDELPTFRGKVLSVGASSAVLYLEALPSLIEC